jgi:uncharacterized protein
MEELRVQGLAVSYSPAGPTALVALHGAGNGTRDSSPLYRHLHETLPPLGVGVATFDRRGDGESEGEPTRGRFGAQAQDAFAVAAALDTERFGLWGFSQGAWVAPLAATLSTAVTFVIAVGAAGMTPAEQMRYADRRSLELSGYGTPAIEQAATLRLQLEAWMHGAGPLPDLAAARDEPWFSSTYLPTSTPDEAAKQRWVAEMDFDPRPVFAAVGVPLLAFHGALDSVCPVKPGVAAWPAHARVVVIPEAEHDLALPDGSLAPVYERILIDWLS